MVVHPTQAIPTAFYWIGKPNFGDLLTPLLLARFSDTIVQWAPAKDADLVCVGSVIDALPLGWDGIVAGSGKLREGSQVDLSQATVLALRGPLTAIAVRAHGDYVLGDPGLLTDQLVLPVDKQYDLSIVPHWSDSELEFRPEFQRYNPHIIKPSGDPLEVIREIGRSRKIVSSSLHGIIVADAFGIPRRTEMTKIFAKEGGDWKFRDHSAALDLPFRIGVTQLPPKYRVQSLQFGLTDMFVKLGKLLSGSH